MELWQHMKAVNLIQRWWDDILTRQPPIKIFSILFIKLDVAFSEVAVNTRLFYRRDCSTRRFQVTAKMFPLETKKNSSRRKLNLSFNGSNAILIIKKVFRLLSAVSNALGESSFIVEPSRCRSLGLSPLHNDHLCRTQSAIMLSIHFVTITSSHDYRFPE